MGNLCATATRDDFNALPPPYQRHPSGYLSQHQLQLHQQQQQQFATAPQPAPQRKQSRRRESTARQQQQMTSQPPPPHEPPPMQAPLVPRSRPLPTGGEPETSERRAGGPPAPPPERVPSQVLLRARPSGASATSSSSSSAGAVAAAVPSGSRTERLGMLVSADGDDQQPTVLRPKASAMRQAQAEAVAAAQAAAAAAAAAELQRRGPPPPQAVLQPGKRSGGGGGSSTSSEKVLRFPGKEDIARRFYRRFPSIDTELLDQFAYAVSINRQSYADAKAQLQQLATFATVQQAVLTADEAERQTQRRAAEQQLEERRRAQLQEAARATAMRRERVATAKAASATAAADAARAAEAAAKQGEEAELILYTTSMTASRQVRDHCRLLQNLLYIRRIRYAEFDVADNPFLQRKLAEQCGKKTMNELPLPLLCVGAKVVGTYEQIQELEDNAEFMPRLLAMGFVYDPAPLVKQRFEGMSDSDDDEDIFAAAS